MYKVLYCITKLELGGAQKQLLSLIRGLDKGQFSPCLFTACQGLLLEDALSIEGLSVRQSRFLERPVNPFKDALALIELYRFIRKYNFEIVHTHSSKAGLLGRLAAKLARVKIIIHTVHGWPFHRCQPFFLRWLYIRLERLAANWSSKLIVVSRHDRETGLCLGVGREEKYQLINYGINYQDFSRPFPRLRQELGLGARDLLVGNISCFKPQKAIPDFLETASLVREILPEVKFLLVGDGALRGKIARLIKKRGLQNNVILSGWRRDIPDILSGIDALLLTSLWEGMPIAVLEAMAAARPVVATDTGGAAEVIADGKNSFLAPPGDCRQLSEKLIALLQDASLRGQIGRRAKESLGDNFTLERMISSTCGLYDRLRR